VGGGGVMKNRDISIISHIRKIEIIIVRYIQNIMYVRMQVIHLNV
jgi:hypothetical protein